jgi:predicted deacylase
MNKAITVAGINLKPGEQKQGNLTISEFWSDGQTLEIPFMVFHGHLPGKTLYIQVAQHGSEVMGLDAIRRLVAELDPMKMNGTLIYCLPNPLAFRERSRTTIFDPKPGGMNRIWPGDCKGSLTERMANLIWKELIIHADEVIDFHTAGRWCKVWVFYEADGVSEKSPKETALRSEEMARLFGAPILYVETEPYGGRKTLRACCVDEGIPAIVPELGGPGHFDEKIVQIAHRGLRNLMIDLGIIEGEIQLPKKQVKLKWLADPKKYSSIAQKGGIFVSKVKLGDIVKKEDEIGFIYSPRTFEILETLYAPQEGYVFSIRENPVVHQGDRLISVPTILEWIENT